MTLKQDVAALISIRQAALIYGLSRWAVETLINRGVLIAVLPSGQRKRGAKILVRSREIETYLSHGEERVVADRNKRR